MNTLIIIAIALFASYTVTVCVSSRQTPDSLSQSVFFLPKDGKWIWTAVIGLVAFAIIPPIIEKSPEQLQFLGFIAATALAFVGFAPLGEGDLAYKVHCGAAILCAVCSQILVGICQPWLLLLWVPYILEWITIKSRGKKWRTATFWAEMVCFANTFTFALIS